ncbi:MAG: helix-turn-helix transcriptional regulator [Fulvimarina manganoxydans]|nr:helix-turn-helix transcriptional regulator [Fulvimarina manganoxydans]MCK5934079.1 helix-turn-helix transcriptional regulator [Fulvimarina manganoxydans]
MAGGRRHRRRRRGRHRRERRSRDMSQAELARALGLTFQQVQKYEKGLNRMLVGKFCQIAKSFGLTGSELLDKSEIDLEPDSSPPVVETEDDRAVRLFKAIPDRDIRKAVLRIMESLAGEPTARSPAIRAAE